MQGNRTHATLSTMNHRRTKHLNRFVRCSSEKISTNEKISTERTFISAWKIDVMSAVAVSAANSDSLKPMVAKRCKKNNSKIAKQSSLDNYRSIILSVWNDYTQHFSLRKETWTYDQYMLEKFISFLIYWFLVFFLKWGTVRGEQRV